MKTLSTITAGLLAVMTLAGTAQAQDWSTVRIATEGAYRPWNFTDSDNNLVGFEIDLANDLCARMEVECTIRPQAWDGIIPALTSGRFDVIMAGMSITDARLETISFSRSYAGSPARFVVLEDSDLASQEIAIEHINLLEIDDAEAAAIDQLRELFSGATIGVQTSTTHENFLRAYMSDDITIRTYDSQENLDLDLQAGRVDAAIGGMSYWFPIIGDAGESEFAFVGPGMAGGVYGRGVGAGVRQEDQALADMFNVAIDAAIADGTIATLAMQWFGFDLSAH